MIQCVLTQGADAPDWRPGPNSAAPSAGLAALTMPGPAPGGGAAVGTEVAQASVRLVIPIQ